MLHYADRIARAERAAIIRGDQSPLDMLDAAYEDKYGRLPHEPGYGTEPVLVAVARTPAELPACDDASHLDVPPVPEPARAA